jgi:ABC-type transport system substrate-binding protein
VADYFTPCAIQYGCVGDKWPAFDPVKAKQLLTEAGFPNGFKTKIQYRDVVRGYLPNPSGVAQDIQAQLKANLNIDATIDVQESATYLDNNSAGKLDGLFLLGWGADYPDITDFLDVHFGIGAGKKFGKSFDDIAKAISTGSSTTDDATRTAQYTAANNDLITEVPMVPIAHGGSATAWKADVDGAHSSPLTNESLAVLAPAGRNQVVFMQNAEPNSLYCADETDGETLRACEQVYESLYQYKVGSTETEPGLATGCTPNADLTVWTCTLRAGVKFSDGAALDANDVVTSYASAWDTLHPLHKGRSGAFEYFPSLFGGFLNPPAP